MNINLTGEYMTRDGKRVSIQRLDGIGTFSVKGYIWLMFRGKERPRRWQIWKPNGAITALEKSHPLDIVGVWQG